MTRWASAVLLVAATAVVIWRAAPSGESAGHWTEVERKDLVIGVEVTGTLRAVESARLGPPTVRRMYNFKISMMVPEGTRVISGTPVIAFDSTELQQRLQTTMTELESVSKQLEKQRIDLAMSEADDRLRIAEAEAAVRTASLMAELPPGLVASIEYRKNLLDLEQSTRAVEALRREVQSSNRAALAELAGLESDLERASNKVREIRESLAAMTVTAPRDGLVIYTTDWQGQKMKTGDTCWRDRKPVEIPDLTRMTADGEVREAEAGQLAEGQPVRLRLDAHPDVEYSGSVAGLSRIVQKKSFWNPLRVVRLEIALDRTDPERMRPAMRFKGEIEIDRLRDVLVIPLQAVQIAADGPVVLRRRGSGFKAIPVELGRRNRFDVEIVAGVKAGDVVRTSAPPDWGAP